MNVQIHQLTQSQPVEITNATNAYQKGDLYCVMTPDKVYKFPIVNIFRITETEEQELPWTAECPPPNKNYKNTEGATMSGANK